MQTERSVQTICLIHEPPFLLLGMKKRGFGAGRWNGFGGKVREGESVEEAARREFLEEAGVEVLEMDKAGTLDFDFAGRDAGLRVHIFRVTRHSGEPRESEEMAPRWFPTEALPFESMWPDDRHWMPLFLGGQAFAGRFLFDDGGGIVEHELRAGRSDRS